MTFFFFKSVKTWLKLPVEKFKNLTEVKTLLFKSCSHFSQSLFLLFRLLKACRWRLPNKSQLLSRKNYYILIAHGRDVCTVLYVLVLFRFVSTIQQNLKGSNTKRYFRRYSRFVREDVPVPENPEV